MECTLMKSDEIVMQLLHYFITERNYNPIVLHGVKDEIWLENMDEPYKIVRIVSIYIHNNEQLDFDIFKTKQIRKQIKRKTLSLKINVLSIFVNLSDYVDLNKNNDNSIECVNIKQIEDFNKYSNLLEIYPNIINQKYDESGMELFLKLTSDISEKTERTANMNESMFKMKKPIVTYSLIGTNVLVFILMYLFGNGSYDNVTLLKFGASFSPLIRLGQYYRLFTSSFVHIGLLHLLCNMYALYVIGPQIESFFGKAKYITIYIGSAIIANLLSMLFSSNTISAGASGAIFGLLGAMLYFGYHYRVYLGNVLKSQIIPIIIINLLIGFSINGIDNAAHIGGLIGGVFISMALGIPNKKTSSDRINGCIITFILVAFLIYMGFIR